MIRRCGALIALGAVILSVFPSPAAGAPPQIISVTVAEDSVTATSATLRGSVNPNGTTTSYRFEYLATESYEANLGAGPPREPFSGASIVPADGAGLVGSGSLPVPVIQSISGLVPATAYRFRLRVVHSGEEPAFSVIRPFATAPPTNAFELLDHRGWEMVSPIDKGGGAIQPPGAISSGGVFQAAAGGGAFTYSSADSFGAGAQGAPAGSQYLAGRTGAGWASANITAPLLSGSYGSEPDGVPYQLFSGDLGYGLLSNGERCRGEAGGECPVANPPPPGSGAPLGYRDYYRRNTSGSFESILSAADLSFTSLGPSRFELRLVAATPDLDHVVLSSCAALTANATEVLAPGGCDPAEQNLYEWSGGAISLINLLPGESTGTPGAAIAAPSGSVSADGSRIYFTSGGGTYLREGNSTKVVLAAPGGKFEATSTDGSTAYLIAGGELLGYSAPGGTLTRLAASGVKGVLGVSADGSKVFYEQSGAIFLRSGSSVTEIASSATPSDWPAATGTARVSADGSHLLFLSDGELTGYPNEGETEAFLYGPPPGGAMPLLTCVSCNPSGERPQGKASIPGARPNGTGAGVTDSYKPRALSASGNRAFFETTDSLSPQDTNGAVTDVYEWEADGEGTCASDGGCVQLISGGRDPLPSYFLDADESGTEAFFLTAASLYPLDPGSYDVYDAREYGGFAVPEEPIPCIADACQILPEAPEEPTPGTLVSNSGNPILKVAGPSGDGSRSKKKKKRHKRPHHKSKTKKHAKRKGTKK